VKLSAARCAALLLLPVLALAGCASEGSGDKAQNTTKSSGKSSGVSASGAFGEKPTLTVPAGAAPTELVVETLSEGDGPVVNKGDTLVANYLGQTWEPKDGKPNVFDNSYDKKQPIGRPIGNGSLIKGWDEGLVGQKVGSRVLLTIPPALAYGESPSDSAPLAGKPLVFVVDVLDSLPVDASATGEAQTPTAAGLPQVTSESGKKPEITSVKGVKPGKTPQSGLLIKGTGEPIDPKKQLALQFIQADAAKGTVGQETWGKGVQLVSAAEVLSLTEGVPGLTVGSRVVAVTPTSAQGPGVVLLVDVIDQY
jgi:FKBP-type peptidyl-prolyl cis-trans isomerase